MELVEIVLKTAALIATLYAAIKAIVALVHWLKKWKIIRRREFTRLVKVEAEHQKCETEKDRQRKLDYPLSKETRAQLEMARQIEEAGQPVRVQTDYQVLKR
jgi:hypothetical protein